MILMIQVPKSWCQYTQVPSNSTDYTDKMNQLYTRFASAYDLFIDFFPLWKKWLNSILPFVKGRRILEVSFGPGYLLTAYNKNHYLYGLDYNATMVHRAKVKVLKARRKAKLTEGNVEAMPYPSNYFDTVVNTMAFSGYPEGHLAMNELLRVLKPGGTLLLLDYDYPPNRNLWGFLMVRFIELCGDIMKDIESLLQEHPVDYERHIIGGFGSIQLFIVKKNISDALV